MKNKRTFLFFALVAALCLAFFSACSSDSGSDSGSGGDTNVIATFVKTPSNTEDTYYFYEDGRFQRDISTSPYQRGTYTGNPKADGEISLTLTEQYINGSWHEQTPYTETRKIENGSFFYGGTYTRK